MKQKFKGFPKGFKYLGIFLDSSFKFNIKQSLRRGLMDTQENWPMRVEEIVYDRNGE